MNEEVLLPRVLASAKRLGVDIYILDSGSTDRSIEIAESFGCKIHVGKWGSFAEKINWGLNNLPLQTVWVMRLDADEYLTDEFVAKIAAALNSQGENVDGIMVGRQIKFLGKWLRHGGMYPSAHLRITRVGKARYESRLLDEHVHVPGATYKFSADIVEEESKGLAIWSRKHIGYAETECFIHYNELSHEKTWRRLEGAARYRRFLREEIYDRFPLFIRPFGFWFYRYIFRLGFLDGMPGFVFHLLHAFWYRILVDALIFESKITHGASVKKSHSI
ncbi:MAG: glycosyltransferase family 2 protein [Gammaproteobacteria bacterium]|nr:glycosyltransferase family 2 protein [Gammaproteobacteria bacterium]